MKTVFAARRQPTSPRTGIVLEARRVRGVVSNGMLCSARELESRRSTTASSSCRRSRRWARRSPRSLGLDDPVIDFEVTPNRADCLGVRGIARDLAAAGLGHAEAARVEPVPGELHVPDRLAISGRRRRLPAFAGRMIRGVKNGPSPPGCRSADARSASGRSRPWSTSPISSPSTSAGRCTSSTPPSSRATSSCRSARAGRDARGAERQDLRARRRDDGDRRRAGRRRAWAASSAARRPAARRRRPTSSSRGAGSIPSAPPRPAASSPSSPTRATASSAASIRPRPPGMEVATHLILELCGGEASEVVSAGAVPEWRRTVDAPARPRRARSAASTWRRPSRRAY